MTFWVPQPTGAAAQTPTAGWKSTWGWETDMIVWPLWPCFTAHAQMWLEMEELHACFCLQGHSARPQLLLTVQRVQRSGVRTSWSASSLESLATNINMNEGADQPTGSPTGSRRRRAGTKRWTELKTRWKNQSPSGESAWTLLDWGRTEDETESGGMKGTHPPAAG